MFFFKYVGKKFFRYLNGCKYYRDRVFQEQTQNAEYRRGGRFFLENRLDLISPDFELTGIAQDMQVRFIGKGDAPEKVLVGGKIFPRGEWVTVPIDFNSRSETGSDLFMALGFDFKSPLICKSDLAEVIDGDTILVLRRYGGLGDIVMQSMLFPDIRRNFPSSRIIYAIPKQFHALFDGCADGVEIMDSSEIDHVLPRLIVSGQYGFIGDISSSCAEYEVKALQRSGRVDKERPDIWAESMGIRLTEHSTCLRLSVDELYRGELGKGRIGVVTHSASPDRAYPYGQELIDALNEAGYKPLMIHSHDLKYERCEKLVNADLRTLMATIGNLDAMIAVDTGPMHIAGVFGIPVVGIFGVTDYRVRLSYYRATGIQGKCKEDKLPCWGSRSSFCKRGNTGIADCMFIPVPEILRSLEGLLRGTSLA